MRSAFYSLVNFINTTNVNDVYWGAAKKILQNIYHIPNCTINEIADMCYVSTATISRLCRKLNYESFADFKKDVANNLNYFNQDSKRLIFDHQLPEAETINDGKEVFRDHFQNVIHNLEDTYENIQYDDLIRIVDKIHDSKRIIFAGNFLTQSISMQLQIELSYLGKDCIAMYSLEEQLKIFKTLNHKDMIILTSIAGGFIHDHPDIMREIIKTPAYKVAITQLEDFNYNDKFDLLLTVGNDHHSLIGKFSVTYIFEVLEALYHLKYGMI